MEEKNNDSIEKTSINEQIEDKILSDNQSSKFKNIIYNKIIQFQILENLKQTLNSLKTRYNSFCLNFSLLTQYFIFLILLSILFFFSIFLLHYFGFERIFKFDYFFAVHNEYLNYLISDLDDISFNLGSYEIRSQFEDIDNIYFFNIYFKELISMGLLNDESYKKVFPNISINSSILYQNLDKYISENKIESSYSISNEQSKKYIDDREDSLSEIAKLYYQFLPIIGYSGYLKDIYINQTYLIAYEYDIKNKDIIGDYLYFSFPRVNKEISNLSNFYPKSTFISPSVRSKKVEHKEKYNNTFYKENWFMKQDYDYRSIANDIHSCFLSFSNLIYNHYGILNKSNLASMQNYFNSNNKSYIINIIYFIGQKIIKDESLDYSVFALINDSNHRVSKEKYSDNDTFLISKSSMIELALSSSLKEYFHYGLYDKNYNFYKHGVSFDNIDIQTLAEPLKYYKSTEKFNIDLRYFSSFYLYASLFKILNYKKTIEEAKPLTEILFSNKENYLQKTCSIIDFNSYISYLKEEKINCFDEDNLLYYIEEDTQEDIFNFNYNFMPYCICLPLYCLKNLKKKFDINKIEYIDDIILPDKCQNDYKTYVNDINELYKNKSDKAFSFPEFSNDLNDIDISLLSKDPKFNIEDEYYIFKGLKFPQFPSLTFFVFALADNSPLKEILCNLIIKLDKIKYFYIIIELSGMILALIIGNIIIIRNIKKISNVIFGFKKIYDKLYKSESLSLNDLNKENENTNIIFNSNNKFEKISLEDDMTFIKNEKNVNIYNNYINNSNENSLLNELIILYCKYYSIPKEELIKKAFNSKNSNNKIIKYQKENELFQFLRMMSIYIPKFKLNISMNYNFYLNSKLYYNCINSIIKENHLNEIELTKSVIFELLSTECIQDNFGLITNINFKYITNININSKIKNSIKNSMFSFANNEMKNYRQEIFKKKYILIEDENVNDNIKIIWKEKNKVLEEFETNFENDDYLKNEKLKEVFDSFLVNTYYKYLKKIISKSCTGY